MMTLGVKHLLLSYCANNLFIVHIDDTSFAVIQCKPVN